jgi:hypothetical protein
MTAILKTIKLDTNGDISIVDGSTEILEDKEALTQLLSNKLKLWYGEFEPQPTAGIDWLGILNLDPNIIETRLKSEIRKILLSDPYVSKIIILNMGFDKVQQELEIYFEVESTFGTISATV